MPTDIRQYMQELAAKAGVSPELSAKLQEALGNEAVSKVFADGLVARPDYSRDLDKVRDETKSMTKAQWDDWYNREVKPVAEHNFKLAQQAEQYRTLYGDLDGTAAPKPNGNGGSVDGNGNYLTREELTRMLAERDGAHVNLAKTLNKISFDHYRRFGAELDLNEIEKLSREQNLPADLAYERYIAPKVADQQKQQHEAALKAAREEGFRDGASRRGTPLDAGQREVSLLFDRTAAPDASDTRSAEQKSMDAFFKGWQEAAEKPA